ncbi:Glucosamine 6-phosphate N-acetyltransferase [Raphanus sativus]|uniref:Glucosamine 6-phosphate N-acetyltransferase n=1 Tax=Raphanus sativus TaxID=3726 RepID=A0A6J0KEB9_RAPSA|nr:glucosamine 6-phosphate N-acetyltransferase [Raphanus sativus]KAJ4882740.1 Glucosamine 6-phosphate N-acetyltransferase [Raphanus sativus]
MAEASNPDTGKENPTFKIRRLEISDKRKGYMELLGQLTVAGPLTDDEFDRRFEEIRSYGDDHFICVIEDESSGKIVATGSVMIEKKFLRSCGKVGHVEDVVVDSEFRGKNLGKRVVEFLTEHSRSMGCYKVMLDCSVEKKGFYEKCGMFNRAIQMTKYFD